MGAAETSTDSAVRLDLKESRNVSVIGIVENGQIPTIEGVWVVFTDVENLIIRNLRFIPTRDSGLSSNPECSPTTTDTDYCDWNASYDAMTIQNGVYGVWIDHCEFTDGPNYDGINPFKSQYKQYDGLLDIKKGADFITISYTKFYNHDKNMLIGSNDSDSGEYRITFFRNYFQYIGQRSPRIRFGRVHIVNTVYENHLKVAENQKYYHQYAIGLGHLSQAYSEYNVFDVPGAQADDLLGVGFDSWSQYFTDVGSWLNDVPVDLNAAAERVINAQEAEQNEGLDYIGPVNWNPRSFYNYPVLTDPDQIRNIVKSSAGAGKISP